MKKIIVLILIALVSFSCSSDDEALGVNVRLVNVSDFNLENISVNASTSNANVVFTREVLASGEATEYVNFPEVFPNPSGEAVVNGETLIWFGLTTGIDTPLFEGDYTCFIDIVDDHNQEKSLLIFLRSDD